MATTGLRRDLGLAAAVSVVVGSMVGVGIFLGPRTVAQYLPTPGLMLLAWALGGLFVLCGALTYAELGAALPRSGGSYNFIRAAYGPLPAFLNGWSGVAIGKAANVSALAVGFGETLSFFLPLTYFGKVLVAATLVATLALVNVFGVRHAGRVSLAGAFVKIVALLALIVAGLIVLGPRIGALASAPLAPPRVSTPSLFSAFGLALIPVFFAYDGWENSTQVAEEVRDPQRALPRSVVGGVLLVLVLYVLANLVYLLAIGPAQIGSSNFAAAQTAHAITHAGDARMPSVSPAAAILSIVILLSIIGTVNNIILTGPRIAYAMAREGLFFSNIDKVSRFGTPARAILLQSGISLALIFLPPFGGQSLFDTLLTYIIVDSFVFYALATSAVFVLRRKQPDLPRPFRVPLYPWIPLIFVAGSAVFVVNAIVQKPVDSVLGMLIVLAGLPGYVYWRRRSGPKLVRDARIVTAETPPRS